MKTQLRKGLLFHSLKKILDSHMAAGKNLGSQKNGRAMPVPTTLFAKKRKRDSCAFFFEIKKEKP